MRVLYLANRIPWFGSHTGYERLPDQMKNAGIASRTITPTSGLLSRAAGKAVSLLRGHGRISQSDAAARARVEFELQLRPRTIGHLLYGDEHLPFWRDASPSVRRRSILTLHQPLALWGREKLDALADCPHAIVLWQREMDGFRARLKGGTLDFIPHGVDIDFFRPADPTAERNGPVRLLYAGVHLRNIPMLVRIIRQLDRRRDDLHFDLLVPVSRRKEPAWTALQNHPRVTWHAGVTDEQLRELYQRASLLLLPMNDSGVNTAVVEALACGLPVVTTDVGGIRDYGGGTIFPVVENEDDDGMLTLIEKYLADPAGLEEARRRARAFAGEHLAWPLIARRHADVYRRVLE